MSSLIKFIVVLLILEDIYTVFNLIFKRGEYFFVYTDKQQVVMDCQKSAGYYFEENYKCYKGHQIEFMNAYLCVSNKNENLWVLETEDYKLCEYFHDKMKKNFYKNPYLPKNNDLLEFHHIIKTRKTPKRVKKNDDINNDSDNIDTDAFIKKESSELNKKIQLYKRNRRY